VSPALPLRGNARRQVDENKKELGGGGGACRGHRAGSCKEPAGTPPAMMDKDGRTRWRRIGKESGLDLKETEEHLRATVGMESGDDESADAVAMLRSRGGS